MRQLRLVRVSVNISKISIAVKFPCSLKVHLRSGTILFFLFLDQESVTTSGTYPLKEGHCQVNEKLEVDIEAIYDSQKKSYNEVSVNFWSFQIVLATTIASSNSNIPAGMATFYPFLREQGIETQTIESLQKCSDRDAKIYFAYSWKDVRKIKDLQNQNIKSSKAILNINRGLLKNSSFNRFGDKDEGIKSVSKDKDLNGNSMSESRVKAYNNLPSRFGGQSTLEARERVKTNATYNNYNNESNQRRENALKSQVQMLNIEVEKYKEKCRNYERKQRELNMTIKDMKDNIEKKKTKVLQTQSMKAEVELTLSEKQKQLKESRLQNKKLQQKLDDLKMNVSTMEKKLEIKEKAFDEEVRLYSQKISQLEKDINKKTFEYNSLLEKMELNEKNSQLNMKEKEKRNLEEKTQLMKKVQLLTQEIEKLKENNDEKDLKYNNLTVSHKSLITQEANIRNQLHKLEANYEVLKAEFANERNHRVALEREIESLSSAESDKNIFKKKYNETFQQLSKTNEKHDRLQSSYNQLLLKFNQSEQKLKQATKANKQLIIQTGQLSSEVENLRKQNTTLSSEFNSLSAKNQMLTQKLNDTRSKLDAEKQEFEDMQAHYEDKVNYLVKTKEYVESQVEDWKEKYEKQENILRELQAKSKNINDQLLSRHEEYLKLQEANKKSLQTIQELNKKIEHLQQEIQAAEKKQKLLHESLKNKGNDAYELQKKLNEQEQEIYILQEKVQIQFKEFNEKQSVLEKHIQEKDKIINESQNFIAELKNELANLQEELEKTLGQLGNKKKELVVAQDTIREHLQTIGDNEKKIEDLNGQLEQTRQKVSSLEEELDRTVRKGAELDENHKSLDDRWNQYRQATTKALQQLLDQIGLDEPSTKVELLKFPDNSLSTMQINALKNRNELVTKYKLTVAGLQEQLQVYKKQLQKVKALASTKQAELDDEILQLKSKQSQLHEEWMAEKSQLNKVISALQEEKQELLSETEKLKSNIAHLEEINSELTSEKAALQQEIDQREQQISLLNDQILDLKSQEIKDKNINEYSLKEYKEQQQIQMQKIKQTLTQTCERLLQEQREKQQKQARILDLEKTHEQVSLELAKQVNKKLEIEARLKDSEKEKEQLRTLVNYRDKTIEDLHSDLASRNQEIQGLVEKQNLLESERKLTYQSLTETQVMKEKLQKALELEKDNSANLKTQLNDLLSISSSSNQEATRKIKDQKDLITKHESEIQLKSYVIKQLENLRVEHETEIKELNRELQNKKQALFDAGKQIEELKNNILKLSESQAGTNLELQALQDQNSTNLEKITELENHVAELLPKAEELVVRLEEIAQLNKRINTLEDELHKASLTLQATQNQVKNITAKMNNKEEEFRKKIISLQTEIAQKQIEFKDSQVKSVSEWEREKSQLMKELEEQDKTMRDQQQEAKFRIDQLENQIESLNQDCLELSNLLNEKEEEILELEQQNEECERKISDLNGELKSCLQAWDKEKAAYLPSRKQMNDLQSEMGKFQDYASQLDTKTKQLLEISRKKGSQESKFGVTELLRDLSTTLSKSKVKILNKVESEDEKDAIITEYKQLQDKIDMAMRSQNSIYK